MCTNTQIYTIAHTFFFYSKDLLFALVCIKSTPQWKDFTVFTVALQNCTKECILYSRYIISELLKSTLNIHFTARTLFLNYSTDISSKACIFGSEDVISELIGSTQHHVYFTAMTTSELQFSEMCIKTSFLKYSTKTYPIYRV